MNILKHAIYFKGGGGGSVSQVPITQPSPAVTSTTAEVEAAKQEQLQQAAKRKGYRGALFGMSGAWSPAVPQSSTSPQGTKSLLGG